GEDALRLFPGSVARPRPLLDEVGGDPFEGLGLELRGVSPLPGPRILAAGDVLYGFAREVPRGGEPDLWPRAEGEADRPAAQPGEEHPAAPPVLRDAHAEAR